MTIFEVSLGENRVCRAGIPGAGVLTVVLDTVVPKSPADPTSSVRARINLHVGGVDSDSDEFLTWSSSAVGAGDTLSVRILEDVDPDPPVERRPSGPPDPETRCSFCSLPRKEVHLLISGQTGYICDHCVKACVDEFLT